MTEQLEAQQFANLKITLSFHLMHDFGVSILAKWHLWGHGESFDRLISPALFTYPGRQFPIHPKKAFAILITSSVQENQLLFGAIYTRNISAICFQVRGQLAFPGGHRNFKCLCTAFQQKSLLKSLHQERNEMLIFFSLVFLYVLLFAFLKRIYLGLHVAGGSAVFFSWWEISCSWAGGDPI